MAGDDTIPNGAWNGRGGWGWGWGGGIVLKFKFTI